MPIWVILVLICVVLLALLLRTARALQVTEGKYRLSQSERRVLNQNYEREQQRATNLLHAIPEGLLILNKQQHIVLFNKAAESMLGQDLNDKTLISATRDYELDALVRQRDPEDNEKRVHLQKRVIRARVTHFDDTSILVLHDETELVRLTHARREMVQNISHELRHPITNVGLMAETLLNDEFNKPKKVRKMLKNIRRETDTLRQIVEEMRDLSLIESGQMPATFTNVDLNQVVNASYDALQSLAERKNQHIDIAIPESLVILADAAQIERVIRNILHNAIKFTPEDGHIDVRATANADTVTVSVCDSGPGIEEEHLPRIFERFYQEDFARSEGTGLGLAIARHIVLAHEGRIWAEHNPDTGTTFSFTVPLAEAEVVKDF